MEEWKHVKGGEFLIESISPQEIFTPEDFTGEQRLIGKAAAEFAMGEVQPRREDIEALKEGLLPSLLKKAGELGFLSGDIPEEYGGQGLDKVSVILMMEKLSQGGGSFMASYGVHTGPGSHPIIFFGNKDQKTRYLPKIATGEMIAAYALTEPEAGSDALNAKTTATLSPDGKYYVLNGQKQFISNAGFADLFVTYAKVEGDQFTSFIVERNFGGVSVGEEENKMGIKGSSTRSVIFTDVKVPLENVLGKIGRGHVVAFNTLNMGRLKLGGGCIGSTKVVLQEAVTYAKQRVQFDKPIAEFGLIKHKIAEMAIRIFAMESMVYRTAAYLMDRLIKRGMTNRLPLLEVAQKVANDLSVLRPTVEMDDGKLALQKGMVEMAKKFALFAAGGTVQKYMMKLVDEQEVLALISDMVIEIFAMESALLRALKTMERAGDEKYQLQRAMTKVYVNDAFERVKGCAKQILSAIAEPDNLRAQRSALKKLTPFTLVNTVMLRREIADTVIKMGKYPF